MKKYLSFKAGRSPWGRGSWVMRVWVGSGIGEGIVGGWGYGAQRGMGGLDFC